MHSSLPVEPLPSCLVVRPFEVALPTVWFFVCPSAAPCAYSCFAQVGPCAQGRCGRCPFGFGVMSRKEKVSHPQCRPLPHEAALLVSFCHSGRDAAEPPVGRPSGGFHEYNSRRMMFEFVLPGLPPVARQTAPCTRSVAIGAVFSCGSGTSPHAYSGVDSPIRLPARRVPTCMHCVVLRPAAQLPPLQCLQRGSKHALANLR